jgi:phage terminase small subunit
MQSTDKPASTIRQRGRKSASRLAFPDDVMMRPQPPESLTVEEKVIWMEIVEALRADWFRGASTFLLELYCRMIAETRQLATCIAQQEPCSEHWLKLVSVQRTVSMSAAALATKLRLTPRSQFDRNQPKLDAGSGPDLRPWEDQCN